jgi:hypothetical protein
VTFKGFGPCILGEAHQFAVSFTGVAVVKVSTVLNDSPSIPDADCGPTPLPLVAIIELKWLLAGEGIHVHVERLQTDPAYATRVLQEAASASNPALRAAAMRLSQLRQTGH